MTKLFAPILVLLFPFQVFAQFGSWSNEFSPYRASCAAFLNGELFVGTESGLAGLSGEKFQTIRLLSENEGISGTAITAITIDSTSGNLILGFQNGNILFYHPKTEKSRLISDIRLSTIFERKGINRLVVNNGFLWIGTQFGLVQYNLDNGLFVTDVSKILSITSFEGYDFHFSSDTIFVATSQGLYYNTLSGTNLKNPTGWTQITASGTKSFFRIASWNSQKVLATDTGLRIVAGNTAPIPDWAAPGNISAATGLEVNADGRLLVTGSGGIDIFQSNFTLSASVDFPEPSISVWSADSVLSWSKAGALYSFSSVLRQVTLNAPLYNAVFDFTENGYLKAYSSGRKGSGISIQLNNQWHVVDRMRFPVIRPNEGYLGMTGFDGSILAGTWGSGVIEIIAPDSIRIIDQSNSDLKGISNDETYVVILDVMADPIGNLYFLNPFSTDRKPLKIKEAGKSWTDMAAISYPGTGSYDFGKQWMDPQGNLWLEIIDASGNPTFGLLVLDLNGTPANTSDDKFRILDTRTGTGSLPSTEIRDIAFDENGAAWIATASGLTVIYDAYFILSQSGSVNAQGVFAIQNQVVRSIAIDASGRKWLALSDGLTVLSPDGDVVETIYTEENSPLLSNAIQKLQYDSQNGTITCFTDKGTSVFYSDAVQASSKPAGPEIYPNPFIRGKHTDIWISGASKDSELLILSIDGNLIRRIETRGSRTTRWDGLDSNGKKVGSGFYIVAFRDLEKGTSAVGKIAVIE